MMFTFKTAALVNSSDQLILLLQSWDNHQLAWNGTKFDSIEKIFDTSGNVWAPSFGEKQSYVPI